MCLCLWPALHWGTPTLCESCCAFSLLCKILIHGNKWHQVSVIKSEVICWFKIGHTTTSWICLVTKGKCMQCMAGSEPDNWNHVKLSQFSSDVIINLSCWVWVVLVTLTGHSKHRWLLGRFIKSEQREAHMCPGACSANWLTTCGNTVLACLLLAHGNIIMKLCT